MNLSFNSSSYTSNWSQVSASASAPVWQTSQPSDSSSYPSFSETLASVQSADNQAQPVAPQKAAPVTQAAVPAAAAKPAHSATTAPVKTDKGADDPRPVKGATTASDASAAEPSPPESGAIKKTVASSNQDGNASDIETTISVKPGPAKPVTVSVDNDSIKDDIYVSNSSQGVKSDGDTQQPAPPEKTSDTAAISVVSIPKSKAGKVSATAAAPPANAGGHATESSAPVSNGTSIALPAAASSAPTVSAQPAVLSEAVPATPDNALSLNTRAVGKSKNQNAELAFAVKVQGKSTSGAAPTSQATQLNAGSTEPNDSFSGQLDSLIAAAGQKEDGKHGPGDGASERDAVVGTAALPLANAAPTVTSEAKVTPAMASGATAAVTEVAENTAAAPSLKTVQVQLTGADNQRIDLRMLERDGNLTISVRTSDGSLTKALQQQLPELGKQLDEQQVRAEWWTPEPQRITAAQKSNEASTDSGSNGNNGSSDQRGDSGGNRGQQGGRGTQQPDWVEELAKPGKSNQNGKQFAWHL